MQNLIFFILSILSLQVFAQANVLSRRIIDGVVVYQDYNIKSTFYYVPYGLKLVTVENGKPDFKFIQMRYTGRRLTNNNGVYKHKSLLTFKVLKHLPSKQKLRSIKSLLNAEGNLVKQLRIIPISNLKAKLIYSSSSNDSISTIYSNGFFESTTAKNTSTNWSERDFILRLNNIDAQLFWEGFQEKQPILSVNYTISSKMYGISNESFINSNDKAFSKLLENKEKDSIEKNNLIERVINSNSFTIEINTKKWPDLMKQIDLNEKISFEYPVLDVYCYDFNNDLHENLYAKKIEIKAIGVKNSSVTFKYTFRKNHPDIYAKKIKFRYTAKLDKPYHYKITKIYNDGGITKSDWKMNTSWAEILDITDYN